MPATLMSHARSASAWRSQPPRMPAAGCSAVREVLTDGPRRARMLGVFPSAVYLAVPDGGTAPGTGTVLALVTADAVRLPNSLVLAVPAAAGPFAPLRPGGEAVVGAGRITAGPVDAEARRWWRPALARPAAGAAGLDRGLDRLAARLAGPAEPPWLAGHPAPAGAERGAPQPTGPVRPEVGWRPTAELRSAANDLAAAACELDLPAAFAAADRMVGLGPGLTPSGDDVLCGFLVTLGQLSRADSPLRAFAPALGALVVPRAARATTALSATLLRHAARGEAAGEVVDLLTAVSGGGPLGPALRRLLAVGHTSGYDLAVGVAAGGRVVAHHLHAEDRRAGDRR